MLIRHARSDNDGEPTSAFTKDEILTNVMIYWVSQSIGSSMRFYYETMAVMPGTSKEMGKLSKIPIKIPVAVAMFPLEIYYAPKSW